MPLLLASHGVVLWLGSRPPAASQAERLTAAANSLADPRDPALSLQSLRQRLKQAAEKADPVKAARDKLPPDADVEAMVRGATRGMDPLDSAALDVRTLAACATWLDRDPLAALRWLGAWDPRGESEEIAREVLNHLKAGNFAKLGSYLTAVPGARGHLMSDDVRYWLEDECDPATRVAAAIGLPEQADRMEWLDELLGEPADYQGQIATIRAGLDAGKAEAFLERLPAHLGPELLEEIRAAGFPAAALDRFLREYDAYEEESAAEQAQVDAVPWSARLAKWQKSHYLDSDYKEEFHKLCPNYKDWCAEVADGRMDPDEVVARVAAALPGEGDEPILRQILFREFYQANPRAAVLWLQRCGGDVKLALKDAMVFPLVPIEIKGELMATILGNEIPTFALENLKLDYRDLDTPQLRELAEKLPPGRLKEALESDLEGREKR